MTQLLGHPYANQSPKIQPAPLFLIYALNMPLSSSPRKHQPEVIIVGDVHGCYSEMVTLLERCGYRLGNPEDRERFSVVLAGDLVNKVLGG